MQLVEKLEKIDIEDLNQQELQEVGGGESAWYWVLYGLGQVTSAIDHGGSSKYHEYRTKYGFGK